jgi:hypothetical protein
MKKIIIRLSGLLLVLAALAACSFQDQGLAPLVPENAFGFVQINEPEAFIKNVDAFASPLGVKELIGNLEMKDLLNTGLKGATGIDLGAFDLKKPLGIAMLPPQKDSGDFGFILYLPLLKPAEDGPKLQKALESAGSITFASANGYAIFTQNAGDQKFPPAKPMKIPQSLVFTPGTLTVYGDVKSVLAAYQKEWTTLKEEASKEIASMESAELGKMEAGTQAVTKSMLEGIFQGIEQTQSLAIELAPGANGFATTGTVEFAKDGSIAKVLKGIGPGKDIGGLSKYLPMGWLMTGAASGDPAAFKDAYTGFVQLYLGASPLSDTDKAAVLKLMEESFKLSGKNLAYGFDLTVDPDVLEMSQDELLANLGDAFGLNMVMVQDVTDSAAYQKFLKESMTGETMKKYLDAVMAESGFTLSMKLAEQKDGDFAYQEIGFELAVGDPDKLALSSDEARVAATVAASLMQKFKMSMSLKGNRLYMVMGDSGLDSLKKLVSADQAEKPISGNPVWTAWLKTVPADAQYVGNFSTGSILDMAKLFSRGAVAIEVPEADRSGINGFIQVKDSYIRSGVAWDIKEVGIIAKASVGLATSLFMNQAASNLGDSGDWGNESDAVGEGDFNGDGDWFGEDGEGGD